MKPMPEAKWPPRRSIEVPRRKAMAASAFNLFMNPNAKSNEHVDVYISLEEHTHLLAEAVRVAKAQVYQGFCDQLVKLINNHEEFERQGSPTWMALHEHLAIFRQKASELRKGATPENGGKE